MLRDVDDTGSAPSALRCRRIWHEGSLNGTVPGIAIYFHIIGVTKNIMYTLNSHTIVIQAFIDH